jgi:pimeloyl-ACP methyl ester carboxylesterase
MKKFLFCTAFAVLLLGSVWSQEKDELKNKKIKNYTLVNRTAFYLEGFDFANYKASDPTLEVLTDAEILAVRNGVSGRVTKASGAYSIIGHSQGGLRALGYITRLKNQYGSASLNNIDAVVTISGIDQGLKALEGSPNSLSAFKVRVRDKINIVGNGFLAAAGVFDFTPNFGTIPIGFLPLRNTASNVVDTSFGIVQFVVPKQFRPFVVEAWVSGNVPQINGMTPQSTYITNNVVQTTVHYYKVKTGTQLTSEWRYKTVLGIKVWYLWVGYVDVYSTYSMNEATPKFDINVPVGFIVGTDSRTLSMGDNPGQVNEVMRGFETAMGIVEGVHIVKSLLITGLINGSPGYAADANRAKRFFGNIESELNDLKRSTENDGLVAVESQFIPKTFRDPNTGVTRTKLNQVLRGGTNGYQAYPQTHHKMATYSEAIAEAGQMILEGARKRGR